MKGNLVTNYTFNAATGAITFAQFPSIDLERVLLITNVTDNIIIYNFANSSLGGTVATNVLTLDYNTTSMDNGDDLQIHYVAPEDNVIIDDTGGTYTYFGFAAPTSATSAARWKIKRLTQATNVFQLADGNDQYDNVWDNRASLSYS